MCHLMTKVKNKKTNTLTRVPEGLCKTGSGKVVWQLIRKTKHSVFRKNSVGGNAH